MTRFDIIRLACASALVLAPFAPQAHVALPHGGATADTDYTAAFSVGHACQGSTVTTAVRVALPAGFRFIDAEPREGWTIAVANDAVTWTANDAAHAMPGSAPGTLRLRGHLPVAPQTLWFKVKQTCDASVTDWDATPADPQAHVPNPAARLDVLPPGVAPVDVRNAWARPTVPGQPGGVYLDLMAPSGATLVGASSPVAGNVEIHRTSMDGGIMRMRAVQGGLALPAGQTVSLKPNGDHLMLSPLKTPLLASTTITVTLRFVDAQGRAGTRDVEVPVTPGPPGGAASDHAMHMH